MFKPGQNSLSSKSSPSSLSSKSSPSSLSRRMGQRSNDSSSSKRNRTSSNSLCGAGACPSTLVAMLGRQDRSRGYQPMRLYQSGARTRATTIRAWPEQAARLRLVLLQWHYRTREAQRSIASMPTAVTVKSTVAQALLHLRSRHSPIYATTRIGPSEAMGLGPVAVALRARAPAAPLVQETLARPTASARCRRWRRSNTGWANSWGRAHLVQCTLASTSAQAGSLP